MEHFKICESNSANMNIKLITKILTLYVHEDFLAFAR